MMKEYKLAPTKKKRPLGENGRRRREKELNTFLIYFTF